LHLRLLTGVGIVTDCAGDDEVLCDSHTFGAGRLSGACIIAKFLAWRQSRQRQPQFHSLNSNAPPAGASEEASTPTLAANAPPLARLPRTASASKKRAEHFGALNKAPP
jgi:hypothetical protein